jgi:oligogalacturonide transport system substrate-binding protein
LDIPTTWDNLFECAEVMSKDGIYPLAVSASKPLLFLAISYTEQVTNHTFMTEDNTIGFDEDDVATMLAFAKRLLDEKVSPPLNDYTKASISEGTYAGTIAWITDANNYCPDGMNFVTGDFLTTGTASTLGWYSKPSTMYAINSYTEHPTEAGILLDFLLNSTEMADAQKLEKGIPLSSSAQSYLEVEDLLQGIQFEAFKTFEERSLDMDTMNPYVENQTLIDAFQDTVDIVYYKDSSIESQAKTLLKKFNEILNGLVEG